MNSEPVAELALEPMAVGFASSLRVKWLMDGWPPVGTKLYLHPAEPKAKELTDEEIIKTMVHFDVYSKDDHCLIEAVRAILRKAQEK